MGAGWANRPIVRAHQRLDQRGGKIFEYVHGLAAGLAVDIRGMSTEVVSVMCGSATQQALSRAVNTIETTCQASIMYDFELSKILWSH